MRKQRAQGSRETRGQHVIGEESGGQGEAGANVGKPYSATVATSSADG